MTITLVRGRYYWVKRVPKRYAGLVLGIDGRPVTQVRQALRTDSLTEARAKAAQIEAARLAEWEALAAGDRGAARTHYEAARRLAQARGLTYVPIAEIASGDLDDLVARVLSLVRPSGVVESPAAVEAVMGTVPAVLPTMPEVLDEYCGLVRSRHSRKSEAQIHKWRLPRERAVRHFVDHIREATGAVPGPIDRITRADALSFRGWWSARVEAGHKIQTANKEIGHLAEIVSTWSELTSAGIANPFARLRLSGHDVAEAHPFSRDWVLTRLLADGALDGLNIEARDVLLMMVNTGVRPSEVTDAPLADFEISAPIPFLRIAPNGRELKVAHTRRDIPLLGVSFAAAERIVARGGIQRYRHKAGSWSAAVNKYLATNGLRETPQHTAYSLRHYVEDALLAAGVDDRVRADILGHKYNRPSYGTGGYLEGRRAALLRIAF